MRLEAEVRRLNQRKSGEVLPSLDEFGNLSISQGLPKWARLAASGQLFTIDMSAGTAIAPVTAAPVASPQWGLYNADPRLCLVPVKVSISLTSGTAGLGLAVMGAAALGPQTVVSADYASTTKTCNDGSKRAPNIYLDSNPTLMGGTPAWITLENTKLSDLATVSIGAGLSYDIDGLFIARPTGGMVAFEVVGPTGTTALFDIQIVVAMLELDFY